MQFDFSTAPRIVYGRGTTERLGELVRPLGKRAILVRGGRHLDQSGAAQRVLGALASAGIGCVSHTITGEPDVTAVDEALGVARQWTCDLVVGLGGGSALDAAKAVAGLLTQDGAALDYLEVVGQGRPIERPAAPMVAIPTTAGTGTEVTRNAVLAYRPKHFKASMRSVHLIPRIAVVDPAMTDTAPPAVTASTGLDALTQLIEPYVSKGATPLTDGLALQGVGLAARSLRRAYEDGGDRAARDDMALAALMGGICLANAGLGAVHGFAAPLGARFPVPHGCACAALLPHVMAANVAALRAQQPANSGTLLRYAQLAEALTGRPATDAHRTIDEGVQRVAELVEALRIPKLSAYGLREQHVAGLVADAKRASSMRYNPLPLSDEALAACLRGAL